MSSLEHQCMKLERFMMVRKNNQNHKKRKIFSLNRLMGKTHCTVYLKLAKNKNTSICLPTHLLKSILFGNWRALLNPDNYCTTYRMGTISFFFGNLIMPDSGCCYQFLPNSAKLGIFCQNLAYFRSLLNFQKTPSNVSCNLEIFARIGQMSAGTFLSKGNNRDNYSGYWGE